MVRFEKDGYRDYEYILPRRTRPWYILADTIGPAAIAGHAAPGVAIASGIVLLFTNSATVGGDYVVRLTPLEPAAATQPPASE